MKVHGDGGAEINATFSATAENGTLHVFLESHGPTPKEKSKPTRNANYKIGLELLLTGLGELGAALNFVEADSCESRALAHQERKIWAPDFPFPLDLSLLKDVEDLRAQIGRSCAAVGRPPGQKSEGGRYKRLKMTLTCPAATEISSDKLEYLLAHRISVAHGLD